MFRRNRLFLFITDEFIYYVLRSKAEKILICGEEAIPYGVVINGDIKEPIKLYGILKQMITKNKMKVASISFLIHEQNVMVRKLSINKKEMTSKLIKEHIKSQIGKNIYFPFENPILDVHLQYETESTYEVILLITDEDLLQDYLDIFEKLWISNVDFETSLLSFFRLYYKRLSNKSVISKEMQSPDKTNNTDLEEGLMLVALYNQNVSLVIFDGAFPVFSLIEELESVELYCESVSNYIERISNYYSFNMHKGKKEIGEIEIFNFTSGKVLEAVKEKMQICTESEKRRFFNFDELSYDYSKSIPSGCHIPLASGLKR